MRNNLALVVAGLGLAIGGANCLGPNTQIKPRSPGLRGFESAEELRGFFVEQATSGTSGRSGGGFLMFPFAMAPSPTMELVADSAGAAEEGGFSTTNIQELGVDESDIVKNDGQYIYILDGKVVHVVAATPPEAVSQVAAVQLEQPGDSLYLRDGKLIVLSRQYSFYDFGGMEDFGRPIPARADVDRDMTASTVPLVGGPWNDGAQTTVSIIDVSIPAEPVPEATIRLEGELASSRLIDNRLHVVLTTRPRLPQDPTPAAVAAMTLDQWIPDFQQETGDGTVVRSGNVADWQDFHRPLDPDGYGVTMVITLDLDDPTGEFASSAITADAGIVYASLEALYVTDTQYSFAAGMSRTDTMIHKMAFTGNGTQYAGSGLVPGRPLSQYSLGEHEGFLRIATTNESFSTGFGPGQFLVSSGVYVLGESDGLLEVVGKVENIAPGEQIYAARFVGKRGFLVTFVRIDPLFTLDLSDPTNPLVLGELKVPGYSDHIQMLGENHLLTIGKDADDAGTFAWMQGVQLSIFDVTDMTDPQLIHKELIGGRGTHSEANTNPKAFNYYPPLNALAFPIDVYRKATGGASMGPHDFSGLYVYRVTAEDGFEFLGGIPSGNNASGWCSLTRYDFTRGVFIGDTVYAAMPTGVKAALVENADTLIGETTFAGEQPPAQNCFGGPMVDLPFGTGVR